jgi:hypothetical protein
MATGTKITPLAGKGQKILMSTMITANSGKTIRQVAAFEEFLYGFMYNRSPKSIFPLVSFFINPFKSFIVISNALIERTIEWISRMINPRLFNHFSVLRIESGGYKVNICYLYRVTNVSLICQFMRMRILSRNAILYTADITAKGLGFHKLSDHFMYL